MGTVVLITVIKLQVLFRDTNYAYIPLPWPSTFYRGQVMFDSLLTQFWTPEPENDEQ